MKKIERVMNNVAEAVLGTCQDPTARDLAWSLGFGNEYDAGKYQDRIEDLWYNHEDLFHKVMTQDVGFLCDQCGWWCELCDESWTKEKHCNDCVEDEEDD